VQKFTIYENILQDAQYEKNLGTYYTFDEAYEEMKKLLKKVKKPSLDKWSIELTVRYTTCIYTQDDGTEQVQIDKQGTKAVKVSLAEQVQMRTL
jgi:hypothetical protein